MHSFYFHIGDYSKDTAHLSLIEDAIYKRLLMLYYTTESPLKNDTPALARLIRARENVQEVQSVLDEFFTLGDDGYRQKRADSEIAEFRAKSELAKKSALARWGKDREKCESDANLMRTHSERNANAMHNECESDANGMLTSNQQPATINHKPATSNHKPDNSKTKTRRTVGASAFDAMGFLKSYDVIDQTAADWLTIRKLKKLTNTERAFQVVVDEARKAGLSPQRGIDLCVVEKWGGLKAEWALRAHGSPVKGRNFDAWEYANRDRRNDSKRGSDDSFKGEVIDV